MYISIQQLSVTHLYKSHDSGLNLQLLQQTVSVLFFIIFNFYNSSSLFWNKHKGYLQRKEKRVKPKVF